MVITEIYGVSSVTTLVGNITHLNVRILCVHVHVQMYVLKTSIKLIALYSYHFSSRSYQQLVASRGCWRAW